MRKEFFKKNYHLLLAFLLGCMGMGLIYIINGMYPFGNKSILTADMANQYVSFLNYFKQIILNPKDLFYNFSMDLSSNFYGLFAYYLSNPLNILLCLFKDSHLLEGILFLNVLKIGLASLTMSILLSKITKLKKVNVIILSLMYSSMSYNILYSQNIMWIDGTIYLPLVILGIEKIFNNERPYLYILSLVLCIICNFYVGYMVGVFSFIYTIARFIQLSNFKSFVLKYLKSTIMVLLISAILLLPVLVNLLVSKSTIETSYFSYETYYPILDVFSKYIIGAYDSVQLAFGPPNIYCGSLCLVAVLLYFCNSKISIKNKLSYLGIIAIFVCSFVIIPVNMVWHMLQPPVWFPFRYSFLFSFIIILLTAFSIEKIKYINFNLFIKTLLVSLIILLIYNKFNYSYITTKNIIFTVLFLVLTSILIFYINNEKSVKKRYQIFLIVLVGIEMIINGSQITGKLEYKDRLKFTNTYYYEKEVISNIQKDSEKFYRIENDNRLNFNEALLFNYNGFNHASSVAGKVNKNFLSDFGLRHSFIHENSSNTTLPMASILGIKYYIAKDSKLVNNAWYTKVNKNIYKNKYTLSLGFAINDNTDTTKFNDNPLENQNILLSSMSGVKDKLFEEIKITDKNNILKEYKEDYYLVYQVNGDQAKALKIYADNKLLVKESEVGYNGDNVVYIPKEYTNITINSNEDFKLKVYKFHEDVFKDMYSKISTDQLKVTKNEESYIKGTINLDSDKMLFTSIIYDEGWDIKVDNKKVSKIPIANYFIGIKVPKGKHTIEFTYRPKGFKEGFIISSIGVIWLGIDVYFNERKRKDVKKINKAR